MFKMTELAIVMAFALASGAALAQGGGEGGSEKAKYCGQKMMSEEEIRGLSEQLAGVESEKEQMEIRMEHRERMMQRAQEKGMKLDDPACRLGR